MKVLTLCFIGDHGEVVMEKKLTALPLKEDYIIEKSIEFFNDPEPCMIHRSAVMKRIYMQIYEFFLEAMEEGKQQIAWDNLPCFMDKALDIPNKARWVSVR